MYVRKPPSAGEIVAGMVGYFLIRTGIVAVVCVAGIAICALLQHG